MYKPTIYNAKNQLTLLQGGGDTRRYPYDRQGKTQSYRLLREKSDKELLQRFWRFLLMENSKAYVYFFEQLNASGSKKCDGYDSRILDEIYDWEREEVEEIIWKEFQKGKDGDLAVFLPKLRRYDGIGALKKALAKCRIPSGQSVLISQILYENTGNDNYLDVIKQNIDKKEDEISYVAILAYCSGRPHAQIPLWQTWEPVEEQGKTNQKQW